jgi:hypothetical protein
MTGDTSAFFAYMSYLCVIFLLMWLDNTMFKHPNDKWDPYIDQHLGQTTQLTQWHVGPTIILTDGTHNCLDMPPPSWQIGTTPPYWQAGTNRVFEPATCLTDNTTGVVSNEVPTNFC